MPLIGGELQPRSIGVAVKSTMSLPGACIGFELGGLVLEQVGGDEGGHVEDRGAEIFVAQIDVEDEDDDQGGERHARREITTDGAFEPGPQMPRRARRRIGLFDSGRRRSPAIAEPDGESEDDATATTRLTSGEGGDENRVVGHDDGEPDEGDRRRGSPAQSAPM